MAEGFVRLFGKLFFVNLAAFTHILPQPRWVSLETLSLCTERGAGAVSDNAECFRINMLESLSLGLSGELAGKLAES